MKRHTVEARAKSRPTAKRLVGHTLLFTAFNAGVACWLLSVMGEVQTSTAAELVVMSRWELLAQAVILAAVQYAGARAWGIKRAAKLQRTLRAARGTVITETLIAMVPFLLLMSGLAQMTMNNMAGVLTNYAAYQAGRAVWVNEPHSDTRGQSQAKARLAAAASVTPVVTGSLTNVYMGSNDLSSMRATMFTSFSPLAGFGGLGALAGGSINKTPAMLAAQNFNQWTSFSSALDSDSFGVRAARKLTFAHACTEVDVLSGADVGARVRYSHFQAFPWFGWITGRYDVKAGRMGYYLLITRTYTLPAQAR